MIYNDINAIYNYFLLLCVHCNCTHRRVPESEQMAFVMITDLLWLNRQLKYNKENKTIRLIIIENMYNIYKDYCEPHKM